MARKSKKMFRSPKLARRQARKRRSKISERRKKEFLWRGYTLQELLTLPLYPPMDSPDSDSIATLMPSRAKRSLARGLSPECEKLLLKIRENKAQKIVRTHCRGMYVLPEMVGTTIGIHNGRMFVNVEIIPEMIGHALGEFARTRNSVTHTGPGVGATRSSQHVSLK
ncbi:MAG: 30S ribosomal protein S19 [Marine Group II euryarchaeote MED-G38]|nr:MAG: 30S ribosomal protein S19 [Marine Group II euryarchaeote MED-G38]|tara:strand:- start:11681 stop:12181 length:501 start_codon:yes stop_codon:yes gene_type:complete